MVFLLPVSNVRSLRILAATLSIFLTLRLVWQLNCPDALSDPAALLASVDASHGHVPEQSATSTSNDAYVPPSASDPPPPEDIINGKPLLDDIAQYYIDFSLNSRPYRNKFGEVGRRTRVLRDAIAYLESSHGSSTTPDTDDHLLLEQVATALFPFLKNQPQNPESTTPLSDIRSSIEAGSAGIIIPTGDRTTRYAAHLIAQLRRILGSTLPIQIVYAGDGDLSAANRANLAAIVADHGPPLEFFDIYTVFDDSTLLFATSASGGGWAVKAFAALGTRFEKVVVLDADAVFLQQPEVLLAHPAFERAGALLFRDRLLWQHAFRDRHDWWKEEIRRPSAQLNKSLVWTEDYAEECDSGVVVLDKGRLEVFMGLLHICWQNTFEVRDDHTYRITYGDKETWWMGLEMAGSSYEMAAHYGGIVGWEAVHEDGKPTVCSFVIAHVDEAENLLWYNGGLLKNKLTNDTEYEVPTTWMIDAVWKKGKSKKDMSCMVDGPVNRLTVGEQDVLTRSIEQAREMDKVFHNVIHTTG